MKLDLEHVWKALASPVRRQILDLLQRGPMGTGQVTEYFPDLSRYAVMQHLGVLEEANLILVRREGRNRYNYLNPVPLRMIYERWVNPHADRAAGTALQLKTFAEKQHQGAETMPFIDPSAGAMQAGKIVKIETEVTIEAPAATVFDAITIGMDSWWPHRFRPNGRMVFEPFVGGRCLEDWGEGAGAYHGIIVWWEPGKKFASSGPGVMYRGFNCYDVQTVIPDAENPDRCIYRKSTTFWGDVPEETERLFREGARGLMEGALKNYVEKGICYAVPGGSTTSGE